MAKLTPRQKATNKWLRNLEKEFRYKQETVSKEEDFGWYWTGVYICGILTFIGIWIYAISEWGLLIGLVLGWIPAVIGALVVGFAWPLLVLAVGGVIGLYLVGL